MISGVVLITYAGTSSVGFWSDDYQALDLVGRLTNAEYFIRYFDPRAQTLWYRPMVGILWKTEYSFFVADPSSYHLVQALLHLTNCLLFYLLTNRVTKRWQTGLVAALVYATLPLASMAVYWPAVHDPLAGVFYLLTIMCWMNYFKSQSWKWLAVTHVTFIGALLSKEISVTLPVILLAVDLWLVQNPSTLADRLKRYSSFAIIVIIYGFIELIVSRYSAFTQQIGYAFGENNVWGFLQFLSWLWFPWEWDAFPRLLWLGVIIVLGVWLVLKHDRRTLFLAVAGAAPVSVMAPIPLHLFNPRYLYLPLMVPSVAIALIVTRLHGAFDRFLGFGSGALLGLVVVWIVIVGSANIDERIVNHAGFVRQERLEYRPIIQSHPSFEPDTFLYFVDSSLQSLDVSGLMFLRYGPTVTVGGIDRSQVARLRDHNAAFVYYLDDTHQFKEQKVEKGVSLQATPLLPIQFGEAISLLGFEAVRANVKRGESVELILYWRASEKITNDYTVFSHLVSESGDIVSGYDSQPARGRARMTTWKPNQLEADAILVPIQTDVPTASNYRLEIGLYDQIRGNRLPVLDDARRPLGDKVVIGFFSIDP